MMGRKRIIENESGLVSIIITIIIMIVLSLIVLGFAQLSRREQREALDRQLATQAQYAAESGINDAKRYVKSQLSIAPDNTVLVDECDNAAFSATDRTLDGIAGISYTCALVNSAPDTLIYDNIDVQRSRIIKIDPKKQDGSNAHLNTLDLYWKQKGVDTLTLPAASVGEFPAATSWTSGAPGVMRIDLISTEDGFGRSDLARNTFTVFGYPGSGGGTVAHSSALGTNGGQVAEAKCEAANNTPEKPFFCRLSINIAASSHTIYYLRVRSIYAQSQLGVRATSAPGISARLHGEQAHLDVTGKANDILKRVKTGYPISDDAEPAPPAEAAIQSAGTVCKYFSAYPPSGFNDPECAWSAPVNSRPYNP